MKDEDKSSRWVLESLFDENLIKFVTENVFFSLLRAQNVFLSARAVGNEFANV